MAAGLQGSELTIVRIIARGGLYQDPQGMHDHGADLYNLETCTLQSLVRSVAAPGEVWNRCLRSNQWQVGSSGKRKASCS